MLDIYLILRVHIIIHTITIFICQNPNGSAATRSLLFAHKPPGTHLRLRGVCLQCIDTYVSISIRIRIKINKIEKYTKQIRILKWKDSQNRVVSRL